MRKIENSSNQISQIIGVIDDIAFQTNLLALNAGVEAARAGDAGRGFAVVASEVRALAQRCSDAAREIKGLISASSSHVEEGVELANGANEAISEILKTVSKINDLVSGISNASKDQSIGVKEILAAMGQLDKVTQSNAAMVEEMTAASHSLNSDSGSLGATVDNFRYGVEGAFAPPMVANASTDAQTPNEAETAMAAFSHGDGHDNRRLASTSSAALALEQEEDGWEEF